MLKIASAVEIANAELLIEAAGRKNLITDIKTNRWTKFSRFPEQIKISEPRMKSNLTKRKKIFHLNFLKTHSTVLFTLFFIFNVFNLTIGTESL